MLTLPRWSTGPLPRHAALAVERASNPAPVVRCTLAELEAAVERERVDVYACSTPTGPRIGRRWLTREPRCWRSHYGLQGVLESKIFLREVTPLEVADGQLLVAAWRLEIAGEAELRELLRLVLLFIKEIC